MKIDIPSSNYFEILSPSKGFNKNKTHPKYKYQGWEKNCYEKEKLSLNVLVMFQIYEFFLIKR